MKIATLLALVLSLAGCWTPPDATVALDTRPALVTIAEWTANALGAPEACRDWSSLGVYAASSPRDYYDVAGRCPARNSDGLGETIEIDGVTVCEPDSPAYSATIFLDVTAEASGEVWPSGVIVLAHRQTHTYAVAHEIAHALLKCMNGGIDDPIDNHGHGNPIFEAILQRLFVACVDSPGDECELPLFAVLEATE